MCTFLLKGGQKGSVVGGGGERDERDDDNNKDIKDLSVLKRNAATAFFPLFFSLLIIVSV